MEREVVITGIGGQGIQLMAKILAQAAVRTGRFVMLFGIYMGMMRGGPSESTVVVGDDEITAPPIIPETWSALAMHPNGLESLLPRVRSGGLLVLNTTLVTEPVVRHDLRIVGLPATALAERAGNIMGAGMVALGAFAEVSGLVPAEEIVDAMRECLPSHRRHLAEANAGYVAAGVAHAREISSAAPSARPEH